MKPRPTRHVPYRRTGITGMLLLAGLVALSATAASGRKQPAPKCLGGVFVIGQSPLTIGASTTRFQTIVIADGRLSLGEQCSGRVRLRAKKGTTTLNASVPGCPGIRGKVRVTGTFDAACGAFSGKLKAKKIRRTPFGATLTRCGDGVIDPSTGEECEGATGCAGGPACDPTACRCVATSTTIPAGNHRPSASGVSLRADLVLPYVEQPLIATDPDGDTLTYELLSPAEGPGYPQAYVNPRSGQFYLTIAQGFLGRIDLSYRVTDGQLFSEPAAISIDVQSSPDPRGTGGNPVAPDEYAGFDRRSFQGDLLGAPGEAAEVPPAIDLAPLFPSPGDQGQQSSCVGWATAYALKSYQEGREIGWGLNTVAHLFSPAYVYNQINGGRDAGSFINEALQLVVDQGVATWSQTPYNDADFLTQPSPQARAQASGFKGRRWGTVNSTAEMKAALANRLPVVGGIFVYPQLIRLAGPNSVYNSTAGQNEGGHAITFVGYDDGRFGGSFKVINSWSTHWGDGGFFYLPYDFVPQVLKQAYVLEDADNTTPPGPEDPTVPPPTGALPNLQVVSWSASYDPRPRGEGQLLYQVANTDQGVAPAGADVNLMLSRDQIISPDDVYMVYEDIPFDLPSGTSVFRDASNPIAFTFPDTLEPGNYYMAV